MSEQQHIIKKADDFEIEKATAPPLPPYVPEPDDGEGIHLRDYWHAVRKRLWLVAGVVILVTLLAALYMGRQPDVYVAQTRVQVDLESAGPGLGATKGSQLPYPTASWKPNVAVTCVMCLQTRWAWLASVTPPGSWSTTSTTAARSTSSWASSGCVMRCRSPTGWISTRARFRSPSCW